MNPILLERSRLAEAAPGRGLPPKADYTPVRAVMAGPAGKAGKSAAEACLEDSFRPSLEDRLSFLVNGFWLIGRHRILEWDARDSRIAEGLQAQGHAVTVVDPNPEDRAAAFPADGAGLPAGGFDRAMFLSRALGYAGGCEPAAWLKAMHRTLRPGGLLLFHVLDRDRAWDLVRDFTSREGAAGIAFDPRSGEVTVRIRSATEAGPRAAHPAAPLAADGPREGAAAGTRQAVRAFNLAEVQALLAEAGFVLERAYGGWNGGSLEDEGGITGRILVVASKPRRKPRTRGAFRSEGRGLPRNRAGKVSEKESEKGSTEGGGG